MTRLLQPPVGTKINTLQDVALLTQNYPEFLKAALLNDTILHDLCQASVDHGESLSPCWLPWTVVGVADGFVEDVPPEAEEVEPLYTLKTTGYYPTIYCEGVKVVELREANGLIPKILLDALNQKNQTERPQGFFVYIEGKSTPTKRHATQEQAEAEAQRLLEKSQGKVAIVGTAMFKKVEMVTKLKVGG